MARWGREKERSAGLVRVSATLLAGQRPRDLDARNPTDSLATHPPSLLLPPVHEPPTTSVTFRAHFPRPD